MSDSYHLSELEIALNAQHLAHILPPSLAPSATVLDIGCGAGQTLIAAYPDRVTFGLDPDLQALRLGKGLTQNVRFLSGQAEALPFNRQSFDLVVARVSLAYTHLDRSLSEIHRVLRENGKVWMTLHPFSIPWQAACKGNARGWVFFGYIVLNSLLAHFTGRQFSFLGKYESFQTSAGMRRLLRRNGFVNISVSRGRHFIVEATAAPLPHR